MKKNVYEIQRWIFFLSFSHSYIRAQFAIAHDILVLLYMYMYMENLMLSHLPGSWKHTKIFKLLDFVWCWWALCRSYSMPFLLWVLYNPYTIRICTLVARNSFRKEKTINRIITTILILSNVQATCWVNSNTKQVNEYHGHSFTSNIRCKMFQLVKCIHFYYKYHPIP